MRSKGMRFVLLALLALGRDAGACDLCSVFVAKQAQGESALGFRAGFAEQFTRFGSLRRDGTAIPNAAGQYLNSSITQFFVAYGRTDRLSFQVNAPLIHRSFRRIQEDGIEQSSLSGLGDITLLVRYSDYLESDSGTALRWSVLGGPKLPTGSSHLVQGETAHHHSTAPSPGTSLDASGLHDHDLALGSGSLDGIVGGSIELRLDRFNLPMLAQYAFRTTNHHGYRFGNDLTWQAMPGYFVHLSPRSSVNASWCMTGEFKSRDRENGDFDPGTAMTSVFMGPQLAASWSDRMSGAIGIELPLFLETPSLQLVPSSRYRLNFTINL